MSLYVISDKKETLASMSSQIKKRHKPLCHLRWKSAISLYVISDKKSAISLYVISDKKEALAIYVISDKKVPLAFM